MKLTDFLPPYRKLAQHFWDLSDYELDNAIGMLDMQVEHLKDKQSHLGKELSAYTRAFRDPTVAQSIREEWYKIVDDHKFTTELIKDLLLKRSVAQRVKDER